jgi:hypothetical protein
MKFANLMVGADPEFFVQKDGKPYPIVGLLGGDKYQAVDRWDIGIFCGYLEDNVMAEFTITPCESAEQFVEMNTQMIDVIMEKLGSEYKPLITPAVRFEEKYLKSQQAQHFGCMPDHSAYSLQIQQVNAKDAGTLRTAGGHIHIGWDGADENLETAATVARAFDLLVTMPFLLIEPDNERRQLYGKAGSFRVKSYGVECRQLSCHWLSSPELMAWVYNQTIKAVEFVKENEEIRDPNSELCQRVRQIIDNKLMGDIIPTLQTYVPEVAEQMLTREDVTV